MGSVCVANYSTGRKSACLFLDGWMENSASWYGTLVWGDGRKEMCVRYGLLSLWLCVCVCVSFASTGTYSFGVFWVFLGTFVVHSRETHPHRERQKDIIISLVSIPTF